MSVYREWFRVVLEHAYYGAGGSGHWRLAPSPASAALLRRLGARMRALPDALAVLAPADAIARFDADQDGAEPLTFLAFANDLLVGACTLPQAPADRILCADSRDAVQEPDGAWRLHAGAALGADALAALEAFDGRDLPGPSRPQLLVRIAAPCGAPDHANGAGGADGAGRRYVARLEAAACHWKYYLLDGLAARTLAIVDLDECVVFRRIDEDALAGRPAAVFLSDRAIALRERPPQRFQLRERAPFGDKVLMKRLPVARAGIRGRAVVDGNAVLVSEIFVNY